MDTTPVRMFFKALTRFVPELTFAEVRGDEEIEGGDSVVARGATPFAGHAGPVHASSSGIARDDIDNVDFVPITAPDGVHLIAPLDSSHANFDLLRDFSEQVQGEPSRRVTTAAMVQSLTPHFDYMDSAPACDLDTFIKMTRVRNGGVTAGHFAECREARTAIPWTCSQPRVGASYVRLEIGCILLYMIDYIAIQARTQHSAEKITKLESKNAKVDGICAWRLNSTRSHQNTTES